MEYYLELYLTSNLEFHEELPQIIVDFGNNEASRGAVMSGLGKAQNVKFKAYDIDDNGKRWDKEL